MIILCLKRIFFWHKGQDSLAGIFNFFVFADFVDEISLIVQFISLSKSLNVLFVVVLCNPLKLS